MPSQPSDRAAPGDLPAEAPKPGSLRDASGPTAAAKAARRPLAPTHVTDTTDHAQHHRPRKAQS